MFYKRFLIILLICCGVYLYNNIKKTLALDLPVLRYKKTHRPVCSGFEWLTRTCLLSFVCIDYDGKLVQLDTSISPQPVSIFPFHVTYNNKVKEFETISKYTIPLGHVDPLNVISGVTIMFGEYNAENFGLVLNDSVLPWFKMIREFDIGVDDVGGVVRLSGNSMLKYSCDERVMVGKLKSRALCDKFLNDFSQHLFHKHVTTLKDYSPGTCFENVVIGMGMLSDHGFDWSTHGEKLDLPLHHVSQSMVASGPTMRSFRRFLLKSDFEMKKGKTVVVPRRGSSKGIENIEEITIGLSDEINYIVPSNMTLEEQFEMFRDAEIVVVTTGGGSLIAQVAPNDATIVLISPRKVDYEFWFSLPHFRVIPYTHIKRKGSRNYGTKMIKELL